MRPCRLVVIAVLALSGLAAGCGSQAAAPGDVALGEEFELRAGAAATVGEEALPVAFERVVEDSRCPIDAQCIQAGRALVQLQAGQDRPRLEPGQSAVAGRYRVRLLRVTPYPASAAPIQPSAYRVVLVVERA